MTETVEIVEMGPRDGLHNERRLIPAADKIALVDLLGHSDADLARASLGLHDAQSVIAREYGLDSWNALRERVEELTLEFGFATDGFIEAATDGRADRAANAIRDHWNGPENEDEVESLLLAYGTSVDVGGWRLGLLI